MKNPKNGTVTADATRRRLLEDVKAALSSIDIGKPNIHSRSNEENTSSSLQFLSSKDNDKTAQNVMLLDGVQNANNRVKLHNSKRVGEHHLFELFLAPGSVTDEKKGETKFRDEIKGMTMLERCQKIINKNEEGGCFQVVLNGYELNKNGKGVSNESLMHHDPLISPCKSIQQAQAIMNRYGLSGNEKNEYPIGLPKQTISPVSTEKKSSETISSSSSPRVLSIQRAQSIMSKHGSCPNVEEVTREVASPSSCNDHNLSIIMDDGTCGDKISESAVNIEDHKKIIQSKDESKVYNNKTMMMISRRHKIATRNNCKVKKKMESNDSTPPQDRAEETGKGNNDYTPLLYGTTISKENVLGDHSNHNLVPEDKESQRPTANGTPCSDTESKGDGIEFSGHEHNERKSPGGNGIGKLSSSIKRKKFRDARRRRSSERRE